MEPPRDPTRHRAMRNPARHLVVGIVVAGLLLAACGSSGGSGSPGVSPGPILDAEDAAAAVAAHNPLFGGIGPKDPNAIGQANWWEVTPAEAAKPPVPWTVTFRIGWGDCQAGCIDQHTWTYQVGADGTVSFVGDSGSPLTQDVIQQRQAAATVTGVGGRVTAGPVCPVENPNNPGQCVPRAVGGAVLVVQGAGGTEVARVTTDASGLFRVDLQPGSYVLEPQPVEGLMGTAAAMPFTVAQGAQAFLDVQYDTGIR